jgi:hypothetical protein
LTISIRSSNSRRSVPTHRSATRVGLRCLRRRQQDSDALAGEQGVESAAELGVSVPDQEPNAGGPVGQVHHQVASLLGNPLAGGVGRDAQQMNPPGGELDREQYIQPGEQQRVHGEEVGGQHEVGLGGEELPVPFGNSATALDVRFCPLCDRRLTTRCRA